jgi:hypothetical protein
MDTTNDFLVGSGGDAIVILLAASATRMTKEKALRLAAYLVALADDDDQFPAVLAAVRNA